MSHIIKKLKIKVASVIASTYVGRLVSLVYRDKIPAAYSLTINTESIKIADSAKASIFFKIYEGAEMRFVNAYLPRDKDVIELGGSIGVISSLIRGRTNSESKLFVVEADKELIPSIEKNIQQNNPGSHYSVTHGAVTYTDIHDGTVRFFETKQNTGGNKYGSSITDIRENYVPALSLASILEEHNIDHFSLVSDIEGAEYEILQYDLKALERCDFMIIELHNIKHEGREVNIETMLDRLKGIGFRVIDSDGSAVFVLTR